MKPASFLKRAAAAAVTVFFFIAGAPALYAEDTAHDISLNSLNITTSGSYVVEGGGTTTSNYITVNSGVTATITLKSVSISSDCALELKSGAKVTLILEGENTLTSSSSAGILVPSGSDLTIQDSSTGGGSVEATGSYYSAAGIGGGNGESGGTITILGGSVEANGYNNAAGIGGGDGGSGGTVTISGGTVEANGGVNAAGIGGGFNGSGGTVKISGSTTSVTVEGSTDDSGLKGRDIGAGYGCLPSDGGTLTVGGGAHLTLVTGMDNSILPKNVKLGDCTITGAGAGEYAGIHFAPEPQVTSGSNEQVADAPVFFRSTNGSGVEIDLSALALPAGVTLVSKDFSGLPTQAAGKVWTLSQRLVGTNGTLQGKDYLALYELSLTDENGKPITGYIGRVTVRLPIPSGSSGNLHLLYLNESSGGFTEMVAVRDGNYLTYSSTHFSSYLITNNGGNSAGEKPTIPETGAPSFPSAAAGVVVVLTLFSASILCKKLKQ